MTKRGNGTLPKIDVVIDALTYITVSVVNTCTVLLNLSSSILKMCWKHGSNTLHY